MVPSHPQRVHRQELGVSAYGLAPGINDDVHGFCFTRGEAEQKAARKLGVPAETIAEEAFRKRGRSLTEERDARVDEQDPPPHSARSVQAQRGHITRQLVGDLETLITSNPDLFPSEEEDL